MTDIMPTREDKDRKSYQDELATNYGLLATHMEIREERAKKAIRNFNRKVRLSHFSIPVSHSRHQEFGWDDLICTAIYRIRHDTCLRAHSTA